MRRQLRYSGMIAIRGVVKLDEHPGLEQELQAEYPQLGNGLLFDIAQGTMCLLYRLQGNLINWVW